MKKFIVTIKEVNNPNLLTPEYWCGDETTRADVVNHFGLNEPDVEWYQIEEELL